MIDGFTVIGHLPNQTIALFPDGQRSDRISAIHRPCRIDRRRCPHFFRRHIIQHTGLIHRHRHRFAHVTAGIAVSRQSQSRSGINHGTHRRPLRAIEKICHSRKKNSDGLTRRERSNSRIRNEIEVVYRDGFHAHGQFGTTQGSVLIDMKFQAEAE